MEKVNDKIRIWVTSNDGRVFNTGSRSLIFHIRKKDFWECFQNINNQHPIWTMIIVYVKDNTNTELARFYNFDNKKVLPTKDFFK